MTCNNCGCIDPCSCSSGQKPYYTDTCLQECQSHCKKTFICQYSPVVRIQNSWAVPNEVDLITLKVPALVDILIGAILWNPTYGSYVIISYDQEGQSVKIQKGADNTTPLGTVIPSCTKFLLTDNSKIIIDEIEADLVALTALVTNNTNDIVTLFADVATNVTDINALEASVAALQNLGNYTSFISTINLSASGGAGGALSSVSVSIADYSVIGDTVFVVLTFTFNIITNTIGQINLTLPVSSVSTGIQTTEGRLKLASAVDEGHLTVSSGSTAGTIKKRDESVMAVSTGCQFTANFFYRKP